MDLDFISNIFFKFSSLEKEKITNYIGLYHSAQSSDLPQSGEGKKIVRGRDALRALRDVDRECASEPRGKKGPCRRKHRRSIEDAEESIDFSDTEKLTAENKKIADMAISAFLEENDSKANQIINSFNNNPNISREQKAAFNNLIALSWIVKGVTKTKGLEVKKDVDGDVSEFKRSELKIKNINNYIQGNLTSKIINIIREPSNPIHKKCVEYRNFKPLYSSSYALEIIDELVNIISLNDFKLFNEDPLKSNASFEYYTRNKYANISDLPIEVKNYLDSVGCKDNMSGCLYKNADRQINRRSIRNICLDDIYERIVNQEVKMMCFIVNNFMRHYNYTQEAKRSTKSYNAPTSDGESGDLDYYMGISDDKKEEQSKPISGGFGFEQDTDSDTAEEKIKKLQEEDDFDPEKEKQIEVTKNFYNSYIAHIKKNKLEIDLYLQTIIDASVDNESLRRFGSFARRSKDKLELFVNDEISKIQNEIEKNDMKYAINLVENTYGSSGGPGEPEKYYILNRKADFTLKIETNSPSSILENSYDYIKDISIALVNPDFEDGDLVEVKSQRAISEKRQAITNAYEDYVKNKYNSLTDILKSEKIKNALLSNYNTGSRGINKAKRIPAHDVRDYLMNMSSSEGDINSFINSFLYTTADNKAKLDQFMQFVIKGIEYSVNFAKKKNIRESSVDKIKDIPQIYQLPPAVRNAGESFIFSGLEEEQRAKLASVIIKQASSRTYADSYANYYINSIEKYLMVK